MSPEINLATESYYAFFLLYRCVHIVTINLSLAKTYIISVIVLIHVYIYLLSGEYCFFLSTHFLDVSLISFCI